VPLLSRPKPKNLQPPLKKRLTLFGIPLDILGRHQLLDVFSEWLSDDRTHFVITANALFLLDLDRFPELRDACQSASLIIPDSVGITWAARRKSATQTPQRITGIDAAFELCGLAELKNSPVYLLGGAPGVAGRAATALSEQFPYLMVAGVRDGYFKESDEPAILKDIADSRARVVLVAMGMPKQELWIHQHLDQLPPAIYVGVGGAFDVWAGDLKRAPAWMQTLGLEWLFRVIQEPWRAGRILQLPRFALKVIFNHA
jgi:N-acetylglucosaminyldiphosphoundecaprenol N-acetyl-beta-D-mannosaminyltransferase